VSVTDLSFRSVQAGVRLDIRVVPRASRDVIDGVRGGRLVVRVTAPPVDEAANDAVVRLLAETLGVSRRSVRIVSGASARNKTVEIAGADERALRARLSSV
jgi:uncharacterized protein (TIGR00251 family)